MTTTTKTAGIVLSEEAIERHYQSAREDAIREFQQPNGRA
jgi:hypothetical protein